MKEFEIQSIVTAAAIYNLSGMYNCDSEFDDNSILFLLSTADEFTYVGTDLRQYEFAMDEFDFFTESQKTKVYEIESLIFENVNPGELSTKEFSYQVNDFLNREMVA